MTVLTPEPGSVYGDTQLVCRIVESMVYLRGIFHYLEASTSGHPESVSTDSLERLSV